MHSRDIPKQFFKPNAPSKVAFLYLLTGGTSQVAFEVLRTITRVQSPVPSRSILFDPDHESRARSHADQKPELVFNGEIAEMLRANAPLFGDHITTVFGELERLLSPSDIENGMRTTRPLSQLLFANYYPKIVDEIRTAIDNLRGPHTIIPIIVTSTGGGTGSALSVLLMELLSDPMCRREILKAIPGRCLAYRPLVFAADPWSYSRISPPLKRKKIESNMAAFRHETDEILRAGDVQYIYHFGFSNSRLAITTAEDLGRVIGTCLYTHEVCYATLKARHVDYADDVAATIRYRGLDFVSRLQNKHTGP